VCGTIETMSRITVLCLCVAVSGLITDISAVTLISACFIYYEICITVNVCRFVFYKMDLTQNLSVILSINRSHGLITLGFTSCFM
jgi:hypothetical protein